MERVKLIECPRDAWQGLPKVIPTETKVAYLSKLIELGFRHIDAVSFVAPRYVPQMADSEIVMQKLAGDWWKTKLENGKSKLGPGGRISNFAFRVSEPAGSPLVPDNVPEIIGIVVNERGLGRSLAVSGVTTIGYPHSVSAKFLQHNAHLSLDESRTLVEKVKRATQAAGRSLVVYLSMAFGNPYGEPWGPETVVEEVRWLRGIGVRAVSLADTVGKAEPRQVSDLFRAVKEFAESQNGMEIGFHLHSRPEGAAENVVAAYDAGCRRFDSALTGLGGCPFAGDELVGNIPTEIVVATLAARGILVGIEPWALLSAVETTKEIRRQYAD